MNIIEYTTFEIFTGGSQTIGRSNSWPSGNSKLANIRRNEDTSKRSIFASNLALGLIIWQGALGWLTVKIDNIHWSVAMHLSSALAFILSLIWLWICINRDEGIQPSWLEFDPILGSKWKNRIAWLGLSTFTTVFAGVFVDSTPGADQICGVSGDVNSWSICN